MVKITLDSFCFKAENRNEPNFREGFMSRKTENLLKGIALGMVVGAVAYVMSSDSMRRTRRVMKRNAVRAVRSAQDFMDDVGYMLH